MLARAGGPVRTSHHQSPCMSHMSALRLVFTFGRGQHLSAKFRCARTNFWRLEVVCSLLDVAIVGSFWQRPRQWRHMIILHHVSLACTGKNVRGGSSAAATYKRGPQHPI
jgi:hypothetical protein